jgi:hypothetical protein
MLTELRTFTSSPPLNSPSLLISSTKLCKEKNCQFDSEDFQLVLERKLELMVKTPGEFSEFINLKKLSNSSFANQRTVGISSRI